MLRYPSLFAKSWRVFLIFGASPKISFLIRIESLEEFSPSKDNSVVLVFKLALPKHFFSRKIDTEYFLYTSTSVTFDRGKLEGRGSSTIDSDFIKICKTKVIVTNIDSSSDSHKLIMIQCTQTFTYTIIYRIFINLFQISKKSENVS